jgi:hypothetical protein
VPEPVKRWPESSWKKLHNFYLSDTGQYSAFPRTSFALSLGAAGVHHTGLLAPSFSFVRTLTRSWDIRLRNETLCLDEFLEMETDAIVDAIPGTDIGLREVEFDLTGQKRARDLQKQFVLTSRTQNHSRAFKELSADTGNPLLSLLVGIEGMGLWFGPVADFREEGPVVRSRVALRNYFAWMSDRDLVTLALDAIKQWLKKKSGV